MATKDRYLNREQINILTKQVRERGYQSQLDTARIQQTFPRIVVGQGLKNSGDVRSLTEVNKFLTRLYKDKAVLMTEEEYQKELDLLNLALKGYKTLRQYTYRVRERAKEVISNASEYTGIDADISGMSTQELNQAIKEAHSRASSDSSGSPSFYIHLMDILENEI